MTWKKSSKCESHSCVEVSLGDRVGVRDSKDPEPKLTFDAQAWRRFVAAVLERKQT